jgi:LuxR family maltose regulon positive regulatory protein
MLTLRRARLLIAQGRPSEAGASLRPWLTSSASPPLSTPLAIEAHLLLTLAAAASGHQPTATHHLQAAIQHGYAERFCRIFLDEGEVISVLLRALARQDAASREAGYAATLLSEAHRTPSIDPAEAEQALIEPFSRVEVDILQLVGRGLSNAQIAQARVISLNTVKWHLRNIYGKLGVKSRAAAIVRSRALNLI